jgi:diadenylate cyclase
MRWSAVLAFLRDLIARVRFTDVLDVIVVAAFVYAVISWVKKARSRFVIAGLAALVALYGVARWLEMYLTLFLFQIGITVALVALIVIFQEEIRRAFERIGTSRLLQRGRVDAGSPEVVEIVVESVVALAAKRIGALIVWKGKEPLTRHVTGGVELDGRVSEALIFSIFDPSSPGHDGAMLIENGIVTRFAGHLPLSTSIKEGARFGTRHAAALGLSERSDALVTVVSEERGVISIARGGTLEPISDAVELKRSLEAFIAEVTPDEGTTLVGGLLFRNLGAKALSLAVAAGTWIAVFGSQGETIARTLTVPVTFRDVPDGWLLEDPKPHELRVTIAGSTQAFQLVDTSSLGVNLELGNLQPGAQTVTIGERDLDLPKGFVVHRIEPRQVTLVAHRTLELEVPVRVQTSGNAPRGFRLENVNSDPPKVRLLIRSDERERYAWIATEPVNLANVESQGSVRRTLIVPKGARLASGEPTEVDVTVRLALPGIAPAPGSLLPSAPRPPQGSPPPSAPPRPRESLADPPAPRPSAAPAPAAS